MEENLKHVAIEARARMMWGESEEKMRKWLCAQRLSPRQIDIIIKECWQERHRSIRRMAVWDMILGGMSLLGSGAVFWIQEWHLPRYIQRDEVPWAAILFLVLFGIWRAVRGIDRFIRGAKTEGSIPDL